MKKKAIIIGAGPAGLTAAYELLKRTDITPIILEKSSDIGGISKTINYKGNRMDIGGHRFFSKSDRVMNWWLNIMPVQPNNESYTTITYQRKHRAIKQEEMHSQIAPEDETKMMLIRKRLSRIYFLRKFFTYPIQLSIDTLRKLGPIRTLSILASYIKAQLFPRKPEKSLEDFLINRFGVKLYLLFFKDYTEKVWGVPCNEISAEWGAQRIKGVSISKAIQHAAQTMVKKKKKTDIAQKDTETSLIEQFLYPALGPGQLWEEVARQVQEMGGTIIMHESVKQILIADNQVTGVITENKLKDEQTEYVGDYFFSTMPVQELIAGINGQVPNDVKEIAAGLQYRDFITIGILLKKLSSPENEEILPDTWIYIQEKNVKVGRLQIFNNWSPYMVKDPNTVWLGMEYFCNDGDEFWNLTNEEIERTAIAELEKMGLAKIEDVLDSTVQRMEKTYPAYFGTYNQFDKIKEFTDQYLNLFLVGRNGMHKYNNSDHSMLTAMVSVDNISKGITGKENIWAINTEQDYHEEKSNSENENAKKEEGNKYKKEVTEKPIEHKEISTDSEFEQVLSFKDFVFKVNRNRKYWLIAGFAIIIQFVVFKYFYPFPSFIHGDSFVYLQMASSNVNIDTYPIGYARFLRLFSVFTSSDLALVSFQYLAIMCSALFLLFTIFYFYNPSKVTQWFLWAFIVFNPLFWHLGNLISSDAIFLALSFMWFSSMLWIIHRPSTQIIVLHSLLLFLAFTVRYNALIYPVISICAFTLSRIHLYKKIAGLALVTVLCGLFILYTGNKYKQLTSTWQFSPFSGWQLANNALYAYRHVESSQRQLVPKRFEKIDNMVRSYFDSTRDTKRFPLETIEASTFYMWTPGMPLQEYMNKRFAQDSSVSIKQKWSAMGPLYQAYGSWIIRHYPMHFIKYFMWPNAKKYYAPPVEFLEQYNMGSDSVQPIAQKWFEWESNKVKSRFLDDGFVFMLNMHPILTGIMNVVFLCGLICFSLLNGFRRNDPFQKLMILATTIWLCNAGFTIFASPAALRFQSFSVIIITLFGILLLNWMVQMMKEETQNMQLEFHAKPTKSFANS